MQLLSIPSRLAGRWQVVLARGTVPRDGWWRQVILARGTILGDGWWWEVILAWGTILRVG